MRTATVATESTVSEIAETDVKEVRVELDINALFSQHRVNLRRFVRRYVRSDEDAEDVVQNTFLEAIRCASRFAGLSKPSTWLYGIALNLARNQVRRICADPSEVVEDSILEQIADTGADPATQTERHQIAYLVSSILSEFPPKIRHTFEAVIEGGWTYEQAADMLHIPVGTVRSRISRVRSNIRARVPH
jgi:RNA polymerase sigma-70 factor (ECF subfamily)